MTEHSYRLQATLLRHSHVLLPFIINFMVEPSNNVPLPPQEATRADLVRMAREDKHTLSLLNLSEGDAIFADPDHYKRRLLARQIEFFIELHPRDYMRCVVCEE